jgi:tetratricopeptide (TPR) repeat protein
MKKRYEGFLASNGLYVLDTFSGEVKFISHEGIVATKPELTNTISSSLIQTTVNSDKKEFTSFEQEVVSAYPYLIARPFSDLLSENDPRMKCKLMVDTFTAILKYMSLQLASEYIRAPELKDVQIHQTLTKDLSRPLISAWNLLIARSLPVFKDKGIRLFSPEIKNAYEKLESKCKDPFLVTQSYSDENGNIKNKTKKLGKIQALINYRNGLAHGFNQSKERAQKEFDEYFPLLAEILQEVRYISRYTLWHVESSKNGVNGIRLMGSNPSQSKVDFNRDVVNPAISPLFIINDSTGEILPLYAFFDVEQTNEIGLPEMGKDVFVFEGSTKNTVIYLSLSGEHLEKTTRFQHWKDLLAQKQMDVEIVDEKNLSIEILHSLGKHISSNAIQALITSGKYLREATVERQDLNEYLDSFCSSTFNGFVLGGESGIGKSTLLAQKTEIWQNEGHMVMFYRGSALNQTDIASKFLRDCALKLNYLEDFLSLVDNVFSTANRNCYLIIDALNEYSGNINDLIKAVENIVAQSSNYSWFKVIVSIRDSAYSRTLAKFGEIAPDQYFKVEEEKGGEKISSNVVRLQPVAKDFTEQLFNAYRNFKWKDSGISDDEGIYKYRPLTTYAEIEPNGTTIELLRNPLMTRLILQSFHRSKLPSQLKNDEAMRLYLDNIIIEKTNESAGFPERLKLLSMLVRELDKQNTERLERDILIKMDSFKSYLINTQKDSPYIQLLELGVLMEEWEKDDCFVRFAFDRFLEFMLAELHFSKVNDAKDVMKLFNRISEFKILQGAAEIIVLRFCNNEQTDILVELSDLADNESKEIQKLTIEMMVNILFSLAIENHVQFESVIKLFPENPGNTDLEVLIALVDKFYITGNFNYFHSTIQIAQQEASLMHNKKILSDLLLFDSQLDMLQGRYGEAREKLELAFKEKKILNDVYGLCMTMRKIGALEWRLGNNTESLNHFELCLELSNKNNFKDISAAMMNNLGVLYKEQGKIKETERLYHESLEIKRQVGDKKGIRPILINLGILYMEKGKIEEAEKMYQESLEISRQLGDKQGIGSSLNGLGRLYNEKGKIEEAEKLYQESLEISRQLGDKQRIMVVLNNLGNLYKSQGKIDEAETLYQESLEICRQLGDKKVIGMSLNSLGILNFEKGEFTNAKIFYLEAILLRIELNITPGIISSIHRAFSLLEDSEREKYYLIAKSLINESTKPNQLSQMANIELMQYCLSNKEVETGIIQEIVQQVLLQKEKSSLKGIDDLPVEAFYCTALKLNELGEKVFVEVIAANALKMIGELRSIRKEYFQKVLIKPEVNKL